jgi:beta-glucosidase
VTETHDVTRWFEDGRLHFAVGIEDTFIPQEAVGRRRLDEYELTQHYSKWAADLRLAADAGADMIRWGIPWYLVEPEAGRFDWRWIDQVVQTMADLGLRCMVDLMHYGTPLWLDNSFVNAAYPQRVADYAAAAAERYRDVLDVWTPLNEPVINAIYCGEQGTWPPYLVGDDGFVKLVVQLARGMQLTQRRIAEVQPSASFVHVDAGFLWRGDVFPVPREHLEERRFLALDLLLGRVTGAHPLVDYLARHGVTDAQLDELVRGAVRPDVLGVNYYPGFTAQQYDAATGRARGVEAGVAGLRELLADYSSRYDLPLFVTETSRGGPVEERLAWLRESVEAIHALRDGGMPLVGYTWFPFFALVDWLYRESGEPLDHWLVQMGLYDLRRNGPDLERVATPLVEEFRKLARP